MYASSIKPSLLSLGPLSSPSFLLFSLVLALQSRSRHNLSLPLSRFMGVELHGEESSIAIYCTELKSFSMCANLKCTCTFVPVHSIWIFSIWPHTNRQTDRRTYTHVLQCSHTSVGLTQARPNDVIITSTATIGYTTQLALSHPKNQERGLVILVNIPVCAESPYLVMNRLKRKCTVSSWK